MRVICPHCSSKSFITSSNRLSAQVSDLYCLCSNTAECGATFVTVLSYKHTLNPPKGDINQLAFNLINHLTDEQKAALEED